MNSLAQICSEALRRVGQSGVDRSRVADPTAHGAVVRPNPWRERNDLCELPASRVLAADDIYHSEQHSNQLLNWNCSASARRWRLSGLPVFAGSGSVPARGKASARLNASRLTSPRFSAPAAVETTVAIAVALIRRQRIIGIIRFHPLVRHPPPGTAFDGTNAQRVRPTQ